MARPRFLLFAAVTAATLGWGELALAQQPRQNPGPDDVVLPGEVERVQRELARIERVRKKARSGEGTPAPAESLGRGAELSPVLAPRRKVVPLRLEEAIGEALKNNPDYLVQLLAAQAAREQVHQERAAFDPVLTHSGTYTQARDPSLSPPDAVVVTSKGWNFTTGIGMRLPTGTQLSLSWIESRRDFSAAATFGGSSFGSSGRTLTPSLQFQVSQPLLRGFGIDVNTTGLAVAENSALSSDAQLAAVYMAAVAGVEQSYWSLVQAEEDLRSQESSLSSSLQLLRDQRKRKEHGAGTQLEVTIAKAGVAQRREAVIVAENRLEAARDQVIRLTRPSRNPEKWDLFVVPVDSPLLLKAPSVEPAAAIQTALERRPDYWQALLGLDSAERALIAAENGALPSVNVIGSWTSDGLGTGHHSAWTRLASGRYYTWAVGVEVELPLFLRAEQSRARAAALDRDRARASLASLEATIVLEVRTALRDLRTARARIEATRANRTLAEDRLKATRDMLEAGTAVPRDVLDDVAGVAQARSAEIQALVSYRLAIAQLRQAQGTLIDDWLNVLPPRVRRALDRQRLD